MVIALYFYSIEKSGGAERMICQLANTLVKRKHKIYLVTWDTKEAKSFFTLDDSVVWVRLGFRPGIFDKFRRTFELYTFFKRNNVQVLVGFVMSGDKTLYLAAKFSGVSLVAAERNSPAMYYLRYNFYQRWLAFLLLKITDRITVQFPCFVKKYPSFLHEKIISIPNPVIPVTERANPGVKSQNGRYKLLAVSRLDNIQKRINLLISAFASLEKKHPLWDLHIVGDGPDSADLKKLVNDLSISRRVFFISSTDNVSKEYLSAHLFVIPSLWEGFPNALAEALSYGLPAVGFEDADGVSDLIKVLGGGWLAKGLYDSHELVYILDHAMQSNNERSKRGALASKSMENYSVNSQYDKWEKLLMSLNTN